MKPFVTLFAAFALAGAGFAQEPAKAKDIDIVICLDVSNSMDGLIASAKAKLWDIINETAKIKPTPNLRVGLYSFGSDSYDRANGFIRKELDLSTDLDSLYQKLFALKTHGGTELATRVSRDALNEQKWADGKDALRIIFVCGNEPANQDNVVTMKAAGDLAKEKSVFINTIFCGHTNQPDAKSWMQLAELAGGRYTAIDQSQNAIAQIVTPHDQKIAELGDKLGETFIAIAGKVGDDKQKAQLAQTENSKKAGSAPGRALNFSNGLYKADWCVVDRAITDAKFDINSLKAEEMPEQLKNLTPEKRTEFVKNLVEKRQGLQKQVLELTKARDEYIRAEQKKTPTPAAQAFDQAVQETIRIQAETRGIVIPKE